MRLAEPGRMDFDGLEPVSERASSEPSKRSGHHDQGEASEQVAGSDILTCRACKVLEMAFNFKKSRPKRLPLADAPAAVKVAIEAKAVFGRFDPRCSRKKRNRSPPMTTFLRISEVLERVGLSRAGVYAAHQAEGIPERVSSSESAREGGRRMKSNAGKKTVEPPNSPWPSPSDP